MDKTPMSIDKTPMGIDTKPMGIDTTPIGFDIMPYGYDAKPMGIDAAPIGFDIVPMNIDATPIGIDIMPYGYDAIPIGYNAIPIGYNAILTFLTKRKLGEERIATFSSIYVIRDEPEKNKGISKNSIITSLRGGTTKQSYWCTDCFASLAMTSSIVIRGAHKKIKLIINLNSNIMKKLLSVGSCLKGLCEPLFKTSV